MGKSTEAAESSLLENSTYNIIHQLENKADFLHSAVEKYIRDAEKDNKPELIKMWNIVKADEQKHLKILREELVREAKADKFR